MSPVNKTPLPFRFPVVIAITLIISAAIATLIVYWADPRAGLFASMLGIVAGSYVVAAAYESAGGPR